MNRKKGTNPHFGRETILHPTRYYFRDSVYLVPPSSSPLPLRVPQSSPPREDDSFTRPTRRRRRPGRFEDLEEAGSRDDGDSTSLIREQWRIRMTSIARLVDSHSLLLFTFDHLPRCWRCRNDPQQLINSPASFRRYSRIRDADPFMILLQAGSTSLFGDPREWYHTRYHECTKSILLIFILYVIFREEIKKCLIVLFIYKVSHPFSFKN